MLLTSNALQQVSSAMGRMGSQRTPTAQGATEGAAAGGAAQMETPRDAATPR